MSYRLPLEMLYHWEKETPNGIFLRQPFPGKGYVEITYQQGVDEIRRIAAALIEKKLPPGTHIAILSKNCAHWMMADYAIWMAGHVSVPLYPNLSEKSVRDILTHSEAKFAFLGKLDDPESYVRGLPKGLPSITFPYHDYKLGEAWNDLLKKNSPFTGCPTRSFEELATIIYTSGTTGEPKGVMHAFRSFAVAGTEILSKVKMRPHHESFFSYLPLAHVAERILVQTCSLYSGASVSFAESIDTFTENLKSVQPTVFLSVPRLWQKFQSGVLAKMPQKKLDLLLSIPIINNLIRKKIKHALGLSRAEVIVTGAAPTPAALIKWFSKLGIQIQEAYGMTENFAYSHFNLKENIHVGSVGQPWPGVETKISELGEILVKSPCNFIGYFKGNYDKKDLFEGEYFKTGDRGEVDPEKFLKITGRTKELFKTSKGKYIAPAPLETQLLANSYLEAGCVLGANLPQPLAVAMLSVTAASMDKNKLKQELKKHIQKMNLRLNPHEQISRLIITREPWTIENGTLTPTMKVKRNVIENRYNAYLEAWQSQPDTVIFE